MSTGACDSPPSPLAPSTCILRNIVYTRDSISFYHFSARCRVSKFPQVRPPLMHGCGPSHPRNNSIQAQLRHRCTSFLHATCTRARTRIRDWLTASLRVVRLMERTPRHVCVRITATARQLVSSPLCPASASAHSHYPTRGPPPGASFVPSQSNASETRG
ncbi:hypothetical protein C8F04DRAFT_1131182 [Mycena alexandri]|uniref:Uncharacterized protein n=1 Tax=Mycena alexandri TaxID=1745969 RepID=A0AAD6WXA9_9AGAR|nr:hypothetical protein C8F04DRAFT_1131182 [Mycena alexandri]